jgi:integrase
LGKGIVGGNNRRELLPGLRKRQERIGDVLRAIRSYPTSMDLRIFGEFLLFSGRRPGELRTLKWSDVEFDRGVYCIREHKSARDKDDFLYAPLSDHLSELLSRWKMVRDASLKDDARDQYVFPASQVNTAEPYLSTSGYRGFATHVAKQCDLADFTAYQLRKFFISVADSIGIPQHTSYLLTGHSIPGARGAYSFALAGTMREPLQRVTDQILLYAKDPATTV